MSNNCSFQCLSPADIVIMDNLGSHKSAAPPPDRQGRPAPGSGICRPYSPDLNPIEQAFAKIQTLDAPGSESAPSRTSGDTSEASSQPSSQTNATTTSPTQDMLSVKMWKTL